MALESVHVCIKRLFIRIITHLNRGIPLQWNFDPAYGGDRLRWFGDCKEIQIYKTGTWFGFITGNEPSENTLIGKLPDWNCPSRLRAFVALQLYAISKRIAGRVA